MLREMRRTIFSKYKVEISNKRKSNDIFENIFYLRDLINNKIYSFIIILLQYLKFLIFNNNIEKENHSQNVQRNSFIKIILQKYFVKKTFLHFLLLQKKQKNVIPRNE